MAELFTPNVTVEVVYINPLEQSTVAGYLFVTNGAEKNTQEQRWMLKWGYTPLPDQGTIRFRAPPANLAATTLSDWLAAIRGLWTSGSTYVKVASISYPTLDPNAPALPYPTLSVSTQLMATALRPGQQIESRDWKIQQKTADDWARIGEVYGTKAFADASIPGIRYNNEYWATRPGYQPPLSSSTAAPIRLRDAAMSSRDEFFEVARLNWTNGSTFTIASCSYLDAIPANP